MDLTHISTFSGALDGMTAAATMAGFETTAFCESNPYRQRVSRGRHPGRPIYGDIADMRRGRLAALASEGFASGRSH